MISFVVRLKFAFIGKKYPNKLGFFGATGKNGFSGGFSFEDVES